VEKVLNGLLILVARRDHPDRASIHMSSALGNEVAPLDGVITEELKDFVLGSDRHFVITEAVAKGKPRCDTISMGNLDEVSACERLAFRSFAH
jgi:hypothetical protein